jgi:hypothetical protein
MSNVKDIYVRQWYLVVGRGGWRLVSVMEKSRDECDVRRVHYWLHHTGRALHIFGHKMQTMFNL